jgi:hypothetical protein
MRTSDFRQQAIKHCHIQAQTKSTAEINLLVPAEVIITVYMLLDDVVTAGKRVNYFDDVAAISAAGFGD